MGGFLNFINSTCREEIVMLGPYRAKKDKTITYKGNKIFPKQDKIDALAFSVDEARDRVVAMSKESMWGKIARINHRINKSANDFFDEMNSLFIPLPLTTRMISSPGAVYGKEKINYTTDTCPITLKWFDHPQNFFLSESSQIYLELSLVQEGVDHVYSIYNSFRKEEADITHLSEFHHIEYEGKVSQVENKKIILRFLSRIIKDLLTHEEKSLRCFLTDESFNELIDFESKIKSVPQITFQDALDCLYAETKDDIYKKFTMCGNFGSWEEVKLTEIFSNLVIIEEYPLLEVPFYHAQIEGKPEVANNADIIWPGYREIIGSGQRITSIDELDQKADIFNLPREDYSPYLLSRRLDTYTQTSGFGLGWERLLQGLLEMPSIWSVAQFPRTNFTLFP